ncbi:hypothetical protein Kpol_507p6 [Vanderwaltozyma polyspora DSM 70294]|uniref:Protein ZIP2 n=1 Tax=Vanderwaltozyma polyspora (strain ATCC 22028 / DSM 70294 / BCRC 21397 / CBS 2163 / NBRC 10782 / NRRL Y-8283 / UCD 57-17) TaxID=436907 RepID=ZIP2_VANPO|nr:uncharacterized protein Kpol_507p6 [Vanderwaltozyma polyspora DSM 70294]A7TPF8.1 RecName: Full=Protein ZIP2; AltName: Full=Zipping up meiotic chromosomes protein 2 [Vanderwaltozyma polyspora DSM 70294]EDO15844.1 hypothetical protein Kpol_507p6 [Vanderwaltozyma polyspora DSM 70294]
MTDFSNWSCEYHTTFDEIVRIENKFKEHLKVDKRTRRRLLECCSKDFEILKFKGLHGIPCYQIEKINVNIEIISLNGLNTNNNGRLTEKWNPDRIGNFDFASYNKREKLLIDKETKVLLSWISGLKLENEDIMEFPNPLIKINSEFNSYIIETCNFCYLTKELLVYSPKSSLDELMPNDLNKNFEKLENEKIIQCELNFNQHYSSEILPFLEFKPYRTILFLNNFLIEVNMNGISSQNIPEKTKREFINWNYENQSEINTSWDINLWSKVFDEDYNEIEFLKLKTPNEIITEDVIENFKSYNSKRFKVYWKLDKNETKKLEWNPIKSYISKNLTTKILLNEKLTKQNEYTIKKPELNFKKILYNIIDLIDIENGTFGSLNLVLNNKIENSFQDPLTKNDESSSINVEKEISESTLQINTSMIPHKRSYIDEELKSILEIKRKKKNLNDRNLKDSEDKTGSILSFINQGIITNIPRDTVLSDRQIVSDQTITESNQLPKFGLKIKFNCKEIAGKTVILNGKKIRENHKIKNILENKSQIKILEKELSYDCDFILNATTCLVRIKLDNFFQISKNGYLFYQKKLMDLTTEFKRVLVLVEYSSIIESTDKDIFWKLHLYLKNYQFYTYIIPSNIEEIARKISLLISRYSSKYNDNELDCNSSEEQILQSLNFNIFLVKDILKKFTLFDFLKGLTLNCDNRNQNILTKQQLARIKTLLTLEW